MKFVTRASACAFLASAALFAGPLTVLPPHIDLTGPEAKHQLLAEETSGDRQQDDTKIVQWTSTNPSVAKVDAAGLVTPISDGTATIVATSRAA